MYNHKAKLLQTNILPSRFTKHLLCSSTLLVTNRIINENIIKLNQHRIKTKIQYKNYQYHKF